jgi:hypothetical protein
VTGARLLRDPGPEAVPRRFPDRRLAGVDQRQAGPSGPRVSSFRAVRAPLPQIAWGLPRSSASVGRRQLSGSDNVPRRVERLDRKDIAMRSPGGRTRSAVPGVAEVVPPFGPADRDGALFDLRGRAVDAGDEPVRERSARSIPVRQTDAQLGRILRDA